MCCDNCSCTSEAVAYPDPRIYDLRVSGGRHNCELEAEQKPLAQKTPEQEPLARMMPEREPFIPDLVDRISFVRKKAGGKISEIFVDISEPRERLSELEAEPRYMFIRFSGPTEFEQIEPIKRNRELIEAERERLERLWENNLKPSYLCDQLAVEMIVKAVTEARPCALGAWAKLQLEAGYLWACTPVDAVPGWKVFTPDPELADYGTPEAMRHLLKRLGADTSDAVLFDTEQTYGRVESFVEGASFESCRRLVTANRALTDVCLGSTARRAATEWDLFENVPGRHADPIVLFVNGVDQEPREPVPALVQEDDGSGFTFDFASDA